MTQTRRIEHDSRTVVGKEFDPGHLEAAKAHATAINGVLYTLFDDKTSYERGVHHVNRYAYIVFPRDLGEGFQTAIGSEIQATNEHTALESLIQNAHTWLMFDKQGNFVGLQVDWNNTQSDDDVSALEHDDLIDEYHTTTQNHNELQQLLDIIRQGGRLEYVTHGQGREQAANIGAPKIE